MCFAAGKVTAGLAESNGSLPPGGWLIVTCGLTACTPGSAPGPTFCNEYGKPLPFYFLVTLPTVAKYCNEHVYVFVCVSASISPELHARFLPIFCACCLSPWLGPPPAGWRNPKGKKQFWGFFPTDNAFYNIAFNTHTGMMTLGWALGTMY